ncbi:mitochondrial ribosomal protein L4 precursor, putative [Plasmodium berghei]|uniref:Large ribosomal subunit protein uL4m n=2 Tax=Plasmodium berghei TaxID=5821 RepID=A0A509AFU3_PLABA|nr:ribosomal protein L4, mitochondrial, putative [Plasmodium berghei ANKA]CXI24389.1 mitochondrial ribosomal protein L4 precursor, putative [Plasmodium berghei]SCM20283.1 mitochondrial ribosomal protein L4 precursor, putative [Plasmodium berghei]SCN23900.1 mitochondrial ribosomal protein L4 precursor, putative [Plasmodium berghei]SCO59294.1 mitochondrial ribosomal protein L4 precursor, putative [Plasmodium berghei]SCO60316.1 mitochondrial ribosomal protein L4 precursor, putative [Plasmodium be|eukprot:XP_034420833.1 ribosomal protein L4, mitochondrial, putative [Plasmodium berghei ANKA]
MFLKVSKVCFKVNFISALSFCSSKFVQKRRIRTFNLKSKLNELYPQNENATSSEKKNMTESGDLLEKIKKTDLKLLKKLQHEEEGNNINWSNINMLKNEACNNDSVGKYYNNVEEMKNTSDLKTEDFFNMDNDNNSEQDRENATSEKYKFIFERPKHFASINDDPIIRRPGCIIDIKTLIRNNWTFPAVGFNSKLEIPIYKFESDENDNNIKFITIPNDIFGVPIRSDILHKCYYFYRTALAGYTERMQLYKWEWPGSTKKYRSQKKSGKARMNWRKTCGRYLGVKNHPIRPFDQRTKINRKLLWKGMKILLSAKFAQDQIKVVDNFLIKSHKTKYTVKYLRNILGNKCNSALLVHEGKTDVNDNFLWACANIASIKRENVEGVNIYNLLKYRYVVFTYKALKNLIYELKVYPYKMKWLPVYATPDNKPAPIPEKVKNWNLLWLEKKKRNDFSRFDKEELKKRINEWKWSSDIKGPLKVKKHDPYKNFILTKFECNDPIPESIKYEYLFNVDDEFDHINDYEDNLNMIDEILNDEDCFENVSDLSLALSPSAGNEEKSDEEGEDDEEVDINDPDEENNTKHNDKSYGNISNINFDNIID